MANQHRSTWFLLLFALPFTGISLGLLFLSVLPSLGEWQAMKSWPGVEAQLLQVTLDERRGDGSTTYQIAARYRYAFSGDYYESDRVAIMSGADNVGSFQQTVGGQLIAAQQQQRTVMAWVNPDNPAEAVLNRDMRWELLGFKLVFVVVFGIVGIGMLYWVLFKRPQGSIHPEDATKPWLTRREWATERIACEVRNSVWAVWLFAVVWNAVSSVVWFVIPRELAQGNHGIVAAALFPLIGLGLLGWAIKTSLEWRRFGEIHLQLDPYPGSIGGHVGGTLELSLPFDSRQVFPVTLSCVHSYMSGSGKHRSRKESIVWQTQGFAYAESSAHGTRLAFRFAVPADLPESETPAERYHLWRLSVKADVPGVDLHRQFELPVFATAEASHNLQQDSADHPHAQEHRDSLIESVLDLRQVNGGVELYYPMWRNAGMKLGWMLGGFMFVGAGVGMWFADAPRFLAVLFSVSGCVAVVLCVYGLLNSLRIRLDQSGLWVQRRLMGVIIYKYHCPRADVKKLFLHKSYSMQSGNEHTEVFAIRARVAGGKELTIGESLQGNATAQQALDAISVLSGYAASNQ